MMLSIDTFLYIFCIQLIYFVIMIIIASDTN